MDFTFIALYVLGFLVLSYFLLLNVREFIVSFRLYPKSKSRDLHNKPIPSFLGIGFIVVYILGTFFYSKAFEIIFDFNSILVSLLILIIAGVRDDLFEISSKEKLFYELVSIVILLWSNPHLIIDNLHGFLGIYDIPSAFSYILTVFIGVSVINSFNLIDGIDGNAAINGIVTFVLFGILFYATEYYAIVRLCALTTSMLIGYLFINLSKKTKGFMGDTGSLFIGFLIFLMSLLWLNNDSIFLENVISSKAILPIPLLCIFIVPIIDTLSVYSYRIKIGKSPFSPDNYHLHHLSLRLFSRKHLYSSIFLNGLGLLFNVVFAILSFRINSYLLITLYFISVLIIVLYVNNLRNILRRKLGRKASDVIVID